jgi:hypothetical protein
MPAILATQRAGGSRFKASPWEIVRETLCQKKKKS